MLGGDGITQQISRFLFCRDGTSTDFILSLFQINIFISTNEERVDEYTHTQRPSEVETKGAWTCLLV